MFSFTDILSVIAPIFILIGIGAVLRKANWFTHDTEAQLFRIAINIFYPCLIFESILGRESLRDPKILLIAPLLSVATVLIGYPLSWYIAKLFGMPCSQRRSFSYAAASGNTGFLGIPIVMSLFDKETLAVYLFFCAGLDAIYWALASTVSEPFNRIEWRKVFNVPFLSIVLAIVLNFFYQPHWTPAVVSRTINWMAECYIPLSVILMGSLAMELFSQNQHPKFKDTLAACLERLILMPIILIPLAQILNIPKELKLCLLMYAAVPAALSSFMVVKYYKGSTQTAFAVSLSTTILSIITTPLWLKFGLAVLGLK